MKSKEQYQYIGLKHIVPVTRIHYFHSSLLIMKNEMKTLKTLGNVTLLQNVINFDVSTTFLFDISN